MCAHLTMLKALLLAPSLLSAPLSAYLLTAYLLTAHLFIMCAGCEPQPHVSPPSPHISSLEGWFAWRLNGGPTRFSRHVGDLSAWLSRPSRAHTSDQGLSPERRGCVEEVREGDLLTITHPQGSQACEVRAERLEGRALRAFGLKLHLNSATRDELRSIKGVGARLAQQIEAGRPWRSVRSLRRLKGVGPKRLKRFSKALTLAPPRLLWSLNSPLNSPLKARAHR